MRNDSWKNVNSPGKVLEKSLNFDFLFLCEPCLILTMVFCVLIRIALVRQFYENTQYTFMLRKIEKVSLFCPLTLHDD